MEDLTLEQVEHFKEVAKLLLSKGLPNTAQNLLDNGADPELLTKLANTGVIDLKKDGSVFIAWHLNRYNPSATLDNLIYKLSPKEITYTFTFKEDSLKEFEDGLIPIDYILSHSSQKESVVRKCQFTVEDLSKYFKKIPSATK